MIDCTWGGTPAEAWTSFGTLQQVMGFQEETAKMKRLDFNKEALSAVYQQEMKDWREQFIIRDAGFTQGTPQWISALQTGKEWKPMELPGYWEEKGLDGLDGIVWFQKEIDIPAEWAGKEVTLSLGMIDDEDITYYNGKEIARGSGFATSGSIRFRLGKLNPAKELSQFVYLISGEKVVFMENRKLCMRKWVDRKYHWPESGTITSD